MQKQPPAKLLGSFLALGLVVALALVLGADRAGHDEALRGSSAPEAAATTASPAPIAEAPSLDESPTAAAEKPEARPGSPEAALTAFADWKDRYLSAAASERSALEAEGLELAKLRRSILAERIAANPRMVVENALSWEERRQLPASIVSLLEIPVSARGDYIVTARVFPQGDDRSATERSVRFRTDGGETYDAYVYGERSTVTTKRGMAVHGYAIDGALAVAEGAVRPISRAELQARMENGELARTASPISGLEGDPQFAADIGGRLYTFADKAEMEQAAENIAANEATINPDAFVTPEDMASAQVADAAGFDPVAMNPKKETSAFTEGTKNILFIRIDFDDAVAPDVGNGERLFSPRSIRHLVNSELNAFYQLASYEKLSTRVQIVPVTLRMTRPSTFYTDPDSAEENVDILYEEAIAAANDYDIQENDGNGDFNPDNYEFHMVAMPEVAFPFSSFSYVGEKGLLLNGDFSFPNTARAFGINLGISIASGLSPVNMNEVTGPGPIGEGETARIPFADPFDIMGRGTALHAVQNAWSLWRMDWLPESHIISGDTSVTRVDRRIYAYDRQNALEGPVVPLAMRMKREGLIDYWITYRSKYDNPWMENGVYIVFGYGDERRDSLLLDTNPDPDANLRENRNFIDAGLTVGRTFTDTGLNVHITPLRTGEDEIGKYIDVSFRRGASAFNRPPTIAEYTASSRGVIASSVPDPTTVDPTAPNSGEVLEVAAGEPVTFEVDASDPNGDDLAFFFRANDYYGADIGERTSVTSDIFSTHNQPTWVHAFEEAGTYYVNAIVSDMQGLRRISTVIVNVTGAAQLLSSTAYGYENGPAVKLDLQSIGGAATVEYEIIASQGANAATEGDDFVAAEGVIDLNAAGDVKTIAVSLIDDDIPEQTEMITVMLSGDISGPRQALILVLDDESMDTFGSPLPQFTYGDFEGGDVLKVVPRNDGKTYAIGGFNGFDGADAEGIIRFNADGTVDTSFDSSLGANGAITAAIPQADGSVVIAGEFTQVAGNVQPYLARLNEDGTFDSAFAPEGITDPVSVIAQQDDGKIIVGFGDTTDEPAMLRFFPDGVRDSSYYVDFTDTTVNRFAVLELQPDGRHYLGGTFFNADENATGADQGVAGLLRFLPDGNLDLSFNIGAGFGGEELWEESIVNTLAIQRDGRVVAAGEFTEVMGQPFNSIVRFHPNGNIDNSFRPGAGFSGPDSGDESAPGIVHDIAYLKNDKLIAVGEFDAYNSFAVNNVVMINAFGGPGGPPGSPDTSFNIGTGPDGPVYSVASLGGALFIGGDFVEINGADLSSATALSGGDAFASVFFSDPVVSVSEAVGQVTMEVRRFGDVDEPLTLNYATRNSGLVAHYRFDEQSGNIIADSSGNGYDGELKSSGGGGYTLGRPGAAGRAIAFSGGDAGAGYAEIPADKMKRLQSFSASFFVTPDRAAAGAGGVLLAKGDNLSGPFLMTLDPETPNQFSQLKFYVSEDLTENQIAPAQEIRGLDGSVVQAAEEPPLLRQGVRSHVVITHLDSNETTAGASRTQIYIDGELAIDKVNPDGFVDMFDAPLQIGGVNGLFGFNGVIDDLQIYDRQLVPSEVSFLRANAGDTLEEINISTGGRDYVPETGTISWAAGETAAKEITIDIINDDDSEMNNGFEVVLYNPNPSSDFYEIVGTVIIRDDDRPGTIFFEFADFTISETADFIEIPVHREDGDRGRVSVSFQTLGEPKGTQTNGFTARAWDLLALNELEQEVLVAPKDFEATGGTLVWEDGDSSPKFIRIPITNDGIVDHLLSDDVQELPETFGVFLTSPSGGATVGRFSQAVVNIVDDDDPYTLSLSYDPVNGTSNETGGPIYNWIDITETAPNPGTRLLNLPELTDDPIPTLYQVAGALPPSNRNLFHLGFKFPFYGIDYEFVGVSTEGYLSFRPAGTEHPFEADAVQGPFPGPDDEGNFYRPGGVISLFNTWRLWVDPSPEADSTIYVGLVGDPEPDTFVVTYRNVKIMSAVRGPLPYPHRVILGSLTAQVLLKPDGRIILQYQVVDLPGAGAGGVQNLARTSGLTAFDRNDILPSAGVAIGFTPAAFSGVIRFPSNDFAASEDDGIIRIPVTRTGSGVGRLEVEYTTVDDGAEAGEDYTAVEGTLVWEDEDNETKYIEVPVTLDTLDENDEIFVVQLTDMVGRGVFGFPTDIVVTLSDSTQATTRWQTRYFSAAEIQEAINSGTGPAALSSDPDGDGLVNLLEYAFDSHPLEPTSGVGVVTDPTDDSTVIRTYPQVPEPRIVTEGGEEYLAITYPVNRSAADLEYIVEIGESVDGEVVWASVDDVGEPLAVEANPPEVLKPNLALATYRSVEPIDADTLGLIRLKVVQIDDDAIVVDDNVDDVDDDEDDDADL